MVQSQGTARERWQSRPFKRLAQREEHLDEADETGRRLACLKWNSRAAKPQGEKKRTDRLSCRKRNRLKEAVRKGQNARASR
jgi:hypothetical protein